MPFYAYIIKSLHDQGYYYGSCENVDIRLKRHNAKKVRSTRSRTPFELHYIEEFPTRSEAYRRELFWKSKEGKIWLRENKII